MPPRLLCATASLLSVLFATAIRDDMQVRVALAEVDEEQVRVARAHAFSNETRSQHSVLVQEKGRGADVVHGVAERNRERATSTAHVGEASEAADASAVAAQVQGKGKGASVVHDVAKKSREVVSSKAYVGKAGEAEDMSALAAQVFGWFCIFVVCIAVVLGLIGIAYFLLFKKKDDRIAS